MMIEIVLLSNIRLSVIYSIVNDDARQNLLFPYMKRKEDNES